eukprot:1640987-Lingulodinium_polyedra.AAC.1
MADGRGDLWHPQQCLHLWQVPRAARPWLLQNEVPPAPDLYPRELHAEVHQVRGFLEPGPVARRVLRAVQVLERREQRARRAQGQPRGPLLLHAPQQASPCSGLEEVVAEHEVESAE